ncbi:hypothetical protein HYW40_01550 [Candidatus Curtissbacteria bacterium]|nr:hypothetical protein [Candidatus Curtissbacteria bacterium]
MVWDANLAYAVGLITTDGNLSKDGRHINLTSKDREQLKTFAEILNLKNKISPKIGSYSQSKCFQIQFGNVALYKFLLEIGLIPNKTKTMGSLRIPPEYFADFLRGHLDGDGCTYSYWDKRWKSSFMLYTTFMSASVKHIKWLKEQIEKLYGMNGRITEHKTYYLLRFAKKGSLNLIRIMYYSENLPYLSRKKFKIDKALSIINGYAGVLKSVDRPA